MATLIDFRQGPEDELLLRCDCGDDHFLSFARHDIGDEQFYLSVSDVWRTPRGTWGRIKALWTLFWKGEYTRSEVQLSKQDIVRIWQWTDGYVPKTERTS